MVAIETFNNTARPFDEHLCIHQVFEQMVHIQPDAPAVLFDGLSLTYKQYNGMCNLLAYRIWQYKHTGPDTFIGICAERSPEMAIGLMGILKSGSAYVPIDPTYPHDRMQFMIEDASIKLVVTQKKFAHLFIDFDVEVIIPELSLQENSELPQLPPDSGVVSTNLAYAIFTSGSTGKPKGVMVEHKSVINRMQWMQRNYHASPSDTILQKTPYTFDVSVWELFNWFFYGAKLYFLEPGGEKDPVTMIRIIKEQKITLIHFVPSMLKLFLDFAETFDNLLNIQSLRRVFASGEALTAGLVNRFNKVVAPNGTRLYNLYGPTEATVEVSYFNCEPGIQYEKIPIGRPIDNLRLYIVDEQNKEKPLGEEGELIIAGVGVARGYLNRVELTAEKFIDDPLEPGKKMYKTGDLCRLNEEGQIEYIGRTDFQLKIRGLRVEPGEIEVLLTNINGISEAVVMLRDDKHGNSLLTAYLVCNGQQPSIKDIKQLLGEKVPSYMVPQVFMILEKMPVSAHGKADRKALPLPDLDALTHSSEYLQPVTPLQRELAALWKELLKKEKIGINDNFFEIGGNSIMAIQFISRLVRKWEVNYPLRLLFANPTILEVETWMNQNLGNKIKTEKISPAKDKSVVPASSPQQRIWFLDQLEGSNAAYNIPLEVKIAGPVQLNILEKSINRIIKRHDALRSCVKNQNGIPLLHIEREIRCHIELIDITGIDLEKRKAELQLIAKNHGLFVFNLSQAPLFSFKLVHFDREVYYLLLNFHHLIFDNWSEGLFFKELSTLYNSLTTNIVPDLPTPEIQYSDFVQWQNTQLRSEKIANQLNYWKKTLDGAPTTLEFPLDHPRKHVQTFNGAEVRFQFEPKLIKKLNELALASGTSLYTTLLTAFALTLQRYSNQNDLVIGCPVANRTHPELEGIIGVFINNLPLRVSMPDQITFKQLLDKVNNNMIGLLENQDTPFEKIIELLNLKRDLNISPLFQVLFNMLNAHGERLNLSGCTTQYIDAGRYVSKLDLSLIITQNDEEHTAVFEYNIDLFKYQTIKYLAGHFMTLLNAIAAKPDADIYSLEMLTPNERHRLLYSENSITTSYPQECFHELFARQALKTPNKIAVRDAQSQLTYSKLEHKSYQLANILLANGLKKGQLVGVMLNRSIDLPLALLAIMKAGGTYVPLDPLYPADRIALIVEDAKLAIFLTETVLIQALPKLDALFITLDTADFYTAYSEALPSVTLEDSAYVIFTSGSTGRPKGVEVTHRGLTNFLWSMKDKPGIKPDDVLLAVTTVSFDIAALELYLPLLVGATVVIATTEEAMDARLLSEKIEKEHITFMQATPVTWRMLLITNWNGNKNLKALCGGEALQQDLGNQLVALTAEVWNMYGPTETTIWSSIQQVYHHEIAEGYEPIGKAIANTSLYILDKHLKPVPIGVPGELFIGGDGVAKGYFNRPELTKERFLVDPFSKKSNQTIYRTGDQVKMLHDGTLVYLNRLDNQVKIRGFRIELGEIETAIARFAGLRQNVVIVREDTTNNKRIVAYLIPDKGNEPDKLALRNYLASCLPEYMIPAAFVLMEKFPLTPNGKVDRKLLPQPDSENDTVSVEYIEPTGKTELMLLLIWKDLLKMNKISATDDFFDLGGHSLLAVSLMGRIEQQTNKRLPLATLFMNSTIQALAKVIDKQEDANDWRSLVPIKPFGTMIPLFLVHGAGLNVLLYNTLINNMSIDQPVYGLQAKGLNGIDKPLVTMEEIAAHYIGEIKSVLPKGPYALAGFSLGGIIAFEMTRQLNAMGERVVFVGMFDTVAQTSQKHLSPMAKRLSRLKLLSNQIAFNIRALASEAGHERSKLLLWKFRSMQRKVKTLLFNIKAAKSYNTGDREKLPQFMLNVHEMNNRAGDNYVLKASNLSIDLFRAMHQTFYIEDKMYYGWSKYALKGVKVHHVPGEHSTIFWPPFDVGFARILQKRLDEVNNAYQLELRRKENA